MFEIFLDIPAQKYLKKQDKKTTQRLADSIAKLAEDPIPHDSKRIMGKKEKVFRIRTGDFRILYRVDYENLLVVVINIDLRKKIYK
ncbi:MAG: type II toxin-antitoxin system RelE/ParE family toxin [archaeon]|nr:type II toxin-antitoxin system RelE/ParE family toxin [archaeon]